LELHMKYLIAYYSKTGNNRFLAEQLAHDVSADVVEIVPRVKSFFLLLLTSLLKVSFGIKKIDKNLDDYDGVILCGPIWMGQLIAPLRDFIRKFRANIKTLYFVTCCASGDAERDGKFGYVNVFKKVEQLAGSSFKEAQAFSVSLLIPEGQQAEAEQMMQMKLTEETFKGKIAEYYTQFVQNIS